MLAFGIVALAAIWIPILKRSVDFKKILPFKGREKTEVVVPGIFGTRTSYLPLIASARQKKSPFVYNRSGRRDPMVPLVKDRKVKIKRRVASKRPPKLSLEGIIWSKSEPEAVINGTILKENDFIKGVKVLKIDRDSVTLIYQSRKFVLRLE
jgi:hypothetical protein